MNLCISQSMPATGSSAPSADTSHRDMITLLTPAGLMDTSRISWGCNFGVTSVLVSGGITLLAWQLATVIYRRYLHPIAHVPGPFLASVSELNRFYYNVIKEGRYYLQYERYREKYGEILRIVPAHLFDNQQLTCQSRRCDSCCA